MNRMLRLSKPMMASCLQKLVYHRKMSTERDKRKLAIINKFSEYCRVNILSCFNQLREECTNSKDSDLRKIEYVVNWMIDKESSSILRTYFQLKENRSVFMAAKYSNDLTKQREEQDKEKAAHVLRDKLKYVIKALTDQDANYKLMAYNSMKQRMNMLNGASLGDADMKKSQLIKRLTNSGYNLQVMGINALREF